MGKAPSASPPSDRKSKIGPSNSTFGSRCRKHMTEAPTQWSMSTHSKHRWPCMAQVGLKENLDFVEEHRAKAHLRILHYQRAVTRLYNRKIRPRPVGEGDLVLRKAEKVHYKLLLSRGVVVERLAEVHRHIVVLGALGERVRLNLNLRMLGLESLKSHVLLLEERSCLGQREHVLLETGPVVPGPLQVGAQGVNLLLEVLVQVLRGPQLGPQLVQDRLQLLLPVLGDRDYLLAGPKL
ncbi:hypothetical protein B296_00046179 [Ensete ventricosum]|uniref:Uncharacterized protein n=1 Tax=Ensete ventricosum TaxID=4639 RepID=A0A426Z4U1_ENSVE|nr:hypothetical protein B296_00046179 [Ensete ventricosum]